MEGRKKERKNDIARASELRREEERKSVCGRRRAREQRVSKRARVWGTSRIRAREKKRGSRVRRETRRHDSRLAAYNAGLSRSRDASSGNHQRVLWSFVVSSSAVYRCLALAHSGTPGLLGRLWSSSQRGVLGLGATPLCSRASAIYVFLILSSSYILHYHSAQLSSLTLYYQTTNKLMLQTKLNVRYILLCSLYTYIQTNTYVFHLIYSVRFGLV